MNNIQLDIQDVVAINPVNSQAFIGDIYMMNEDPNWRFFVFNDTGNQNIDVELTEKLNSGYWYLQFYDGIPSIQGMKPDQEPFAYVPSGLTLFEGDATLISPVTGKKYDGGEVFQYVNAYGITVHFYRNKSVVHGKLIRIDSRETDFTKSPVEYQMFCVNGLPVYQTSYPSWESVLESNTKKENKNEN